MYLKRSPNQLICGKKNRNCKKYTEKGIKGKGRILKPEKNGASNVRREQACYMDVRAK